MFEYSRFHACTILAIAASARDRPAYADWRQIDDACSESSSAVLQSSPPAEHSLSTFLRHRVRGWRQLWLVLILAAIAGCAGSYHVQPRPAVDQQLATGHAIRWIEPALARDRAQIRRWRDAVGSPVTASNFDRPSSPIDALIVVNWNIALGSGDVSRMVRDVRREWPGTPIVLLLQEAYRSGDDIPAAPEKPAFAGFLGTSEPAREIDDIARSLGFAMYYVPAMRNGAPGGRREDRGNAILSSVPLEDLVAIELPFEHQRRVALAAHVRGQTTRGTPWRLQLATVHLDNIVGARHGWIGGEYGRTRQARGLREALAGSEPLLLAGDFNTWFGFRDQAYRETARAFPQTRMKDRRRTFRGLLRLDHVFYRLAAGWTATVRRAESNYGSDHHPLITRITF